MARQHVASKLPVVFVPGLLCDDRLFSAQLKAFSAERHCIVCDISGPETIAGMAQQVLDCVDGPFYLVGLSLGGIVALEVMRKDRARVRGLLLVDTNPFAESDARRAMRLEQIGRTMNGEFRAIVVDELKLSYLAPEFAENQNLKDTVLAMAEDLGSEVFIKQSRALMERPDSLAMLGEITCPTRVVCGEVDELCPPEFHEIMAGAIPDAHLRIIEKCGHLAALECPGAVNEELSQLIRGVEGEQ